MKGASSATGGPIARPLVSVVITTRNRLESVRTAVASCLAQDYPSLEIRVYDDASDDNTSEVIRDEFPSVTVSRVSTRSGYIALRNRAYAETEATYVMSLDDDAWFTDETTVRTLVDQMERDPSLGALAAPFLEPSKDGRSTGGPKDQPGVELRAFVGTAHLCRVIAVRSVGGYRELLVHQGEERDLCVRLRMAGWTVRMGGASPLVHAVSPVRDRERMHRYAVRNQILFDCFYTPWFLLPVALGRHVIGLVLYRRTPAWMTQTLRYVFDGLRDALRCRACRLPLGFKEYRRHMAMPTHRPQYVEASQLPPPCRTPLAAAARVHGVPEELIAR